MAAKKKTTASRSPVTNNANDTSTVSDRYLYYDKLHFIPVEDKDEVWAAQVLAFIKRNAVPFIDNKKLEEFRKEDRGEINIVDYKKMMDPVMPDGKGGTTGGEAKYFHADWKSCPIFAHLDNILEAKIKQIPINLVVSSSDQFAKTKKELENAKIINSGAMRDFLNEFNKKLGYPALSKFDDPYKYIDKLQSGYQPPQKTKKFKLQPGTAGQDQNTTLLDSIKQGINDNESLALYMDNIYKGGAEIACEIGLKYYMIQINRYKNQSSNIVADLKNVNSVLLYFYTSQTTGRPVLDYKDMKGVWTLPFFQDDLSDLKGWFEEPYISFGEFVQRFGANLTTAQLKKVFEVHRKFNGIKEDIHHSYENCSFYTRRNAKIQIGYVEFESQDMEVYANYEFLGNKRFKKMDSGFKRSTYPNGKREERHYNVWYKFYYIPLLIDNITPNYDLQRQAEYIYEFDKVQDQQREGDDYRYVKGSLVGHRNLKKMSWAEIMSRIRPKINYLWFRFQNEMVNAIPNGGFFAQGLVSMMASSADTAGNDNVSSKIEMMKAFKQSGWGMADPLLDQLGKMIGNGAPFMEFKNSMMANAFENLNGMMTLYNMLMQSLSQNAITEGAGSKPRQNATGINATITASEQAIFFISEPFERVTLDAGTRFLYYFKDIIDEKDSERKQEFMDIVGEANASAFQAVEDIPYHNLGLDVNNAMTDDQKELVNGLAEKLAAAGVLMPEDVFFIASIDNVKYAYAILSLKAKQGRQAMADQQQQALQQQMQLEAVKLKTQEAIINAQQVADAKNINISKAWDYKIDEMMNQLKGHFQAAIKDQIGQNKTDEIIAKSQVDKINAPQEAAPVNAAVRKHANEYAL